jgi:hypothetical protein
VWRWRDEGRTEARELATLGGEDALGEVHQRAITAALQIYWDKRRPFLPKSTKQKGGGGVANILNRGSCQLVTEGEQ